LRGGRQRSLGLATAAVAAAAVARRFGPTLRPATLPARLDVVAESAHRAHVEAFGTPALWLKYLAPSA
jgi:hypothetical protein